MAFARSCQKHRISCMTQRIPVQDLDCLNCPGSLLTPSLHFGRECVCVYGMIWYGMVWYGMVCSGEAFSCRFLEPVARSRSWRPELTCQSVAAYRLSQRSSLCMNKTQSSALFGLSRSWHVPLHVQSKPETILHDSEVYLQDLPDLRCWALCSERGRECQAARQLTFQVC